MINLDEICQRIEIEEPRARAVVNKDTNQILVRFLNRPDVEISLLTPFQQRLINTGRITKDDVDELINSIKRIANWPSRSEKVHWHIGLE